MDKNKKNLLISGALILCAVLYTILVKFVDVRAIGPDSSSVGLASLNSFMFNLTGVNLIWYTITDWLGLIPILIALIYGLIGLVQIIKRKSLFKVDKEIMSLGILYIVIVVLYVFFEKFVINYRPILIDGYLEASYPSSHTLMAICISGSSLMINNHLFKGKKWAKVENIISVVTMILIVGGRLISGVHWLTDIIGAILISVALLWCFKSSLELVAELKE